MCPDISFQYDSIGLIVQGDMDGGDCAARTGEAYTFAKLSGIEPKDLIPFKCALDRLSADNEGTLIRYVSNPYNDPYDKDWAPGGDQTIPIVIACGFYGERDWIVGQFKACIKRGFRWQNGDFMSFEDICVFLRSIYVTKPNKPLYAFICGFGLIGGATNTFNTFLRCILGRDFDNVGDDVRHIQVCIQSALVCEDSISWFSRHFYGSFRPFGVQYALDWYHRPDTGGNPINELARSIVKELFG